MKDIKSFIEHLPKIELHLHLEGTLEPKFIFKLAEKHKVTLPYKSVQDVYKVYSFSNLQSFLNVYFEGTGLLRDEQDFYELTWAYLSRVHKENVRHTEVFFDPQLHTERGISLEIVVKGIKRALIQAEQQWGLTYRLIPCFLRNLSEESALMTFERLLPFRESFEAFGLDSTELGNPPQKFSAVFERVRSEGFLVVSHAGEEGPAEYIREALDLLKAVRIDHGVRCLEDEQLVQRLVKEQIPLTVCPLSNVRLKVFETMEKHNLKEILKRGICVTINSDDPSYFGGYMNANYQAVQTALSLTHQEIYQLAKNSIQASFLNKSEKDKLKKELDIYMIEEGGI